MAFRLEFFEMEILINFLPGWQKHRKPSCWSTQMPWTHGDDSHSFRLCWHKGPEYPGGQSHLWEIEFNLMKFNLSFCGSRDAYLKLVEFPIHAPPFKHCDGLHGSASNWQFLPVYPISNIKLIINNINRQECIVTSSTNAASKLFLKFSLEKFTSKNF
jgi:hypothetical protein